MTELYCSVTNTTGILSVQTNNSHSAQSASAQIEALATTLDIGSSVEINLGTQAYSEKVFTGYVKNVEIKEPAKTYMITCGDVMVRAMDYFIASDDPETPWKRKNIKAETLVHDLLELAGITNYTGDNTYFTFGINNDVEVNLTSAYDFCRFIADILAYNLYADLNGQVHFTRRLPYVVPADTSVGTINVPDNMSISYTKSDRDLRNKVIVYGAEGIKAEAHATSPYLPEGFYKTTVVAAPTVFDNEAMAQQSANYNLELLNRLTESATLSLQGDPHIKVRTVMTVTNTTLPVSGDWYVFGVTHQMSSGGYTTSVELRK